MEKIKKRKNWFAPLFALILAGCLIWGLGRLVRPKYASGVTLEGSMVENWYAHKDEGHQVLFVGDCEVYESFSPVTLFDEFGATSYIRGSAQQLMWQSYYLLKEALKTDAPRAVVLSVCSLRYGEPQSEAYNRMTLDGMRLSREKFEAVRASLTAGESELSYYVPLLRYHDRLFELTEEDARYMLKGPELTYHGYLMRCERVPYTRLPAAPVLKDPGFGEKPVEYLDRIVDLCREKGIALILIKSPCLYPAWYDEWDGWLEDYARAHDVVYIDAIPLMDDMGIDLSTDTYDGGIHLNVYGAEKYTRWLGNYLSDRGLIEDQRLDPVIAARYGDLSRRYEQEKQRRSEANG